MLSRTHKCKSAARIQTAQSAKGTSLRHNCRLKAADPEEHLTVGQHQASLMTLPAKCFLCSRVLASTVHHASAASRK